MLPPAFITRLERIVPAERLADVLASFALDKPPALFLNRLRAAPDTTLAELRDGFPDARIEPLLPDAVVALAAPSSTAASLASALARHPVITEGRAYLINPSSLVPPLVLGATPDDVVLDLCAAPGGKTLQLATALGPEPRGNLAAVEAVRPRFFKLQGVLARYGAKARLFMKDGRDVGGAVPERFDKILIDAPCSSEARFDADDAASSAHWSERKIAECAHKQKALLRSGLAALKVGGTLVYCTCSFAPEENEAVVREVLEELDGAVAPLASPLPATCSPFAPIPAVPGIDLPEAWRILPDAVWDGFFLIRLIKISTIDTNTSAESRNTSRRPRRADTRRRP